MPIVDWQLHPSIFLPLIHHCWYHETLPKPLLKFPPWMHLKGVVEIHLCAPKFEWLKSIYALVGGAGSIERMKTSFQPYSQFKSHFMEINIELNTVGQSSHPIKPQSVPGTLSNELLGHYSLLLY